MGFFNPILHGGGGQKDPPWLIISRDFSVDARNELKFHDFVSINICHVPLKPFFKKNFWKFEKRNFFFSTVPTSKGPPFEIFFFKIIFFHFFSNKSYFFNLNLHFTCSELSFDVYNMSFEKILKFSFFTIEFLSMTKFFPQPLTAKIIIKKDCFWYVWIGKDQNFALRTILGHFHANWLS